MIVLNNKDGLGNQMFEYAFSRCLQETTADGRLVVNNFFFNRQKNRSYSLNHFKLNDNVEVPGNRRQLWLTICFLCRLLMCYPKQFVKWMTSTVRPKDEKTFAYSSSKGLYVHFNTFHKFHIRPSQAKTKYIYGNYENYCYVEPVLKQLKEEFQITTPPSSANEEMMKELQSCNSVCVHVRRGDYLDSRWAMMNVCGFEYYQKGMDSVQKQKPDAVFFIFSNSHEDLEWISDNYHFRQNVRYVDLGNPDYEELRLMVGCKHFIISNSTFSWWAAVLSENTDKMVVAPSPWVLTEDEQEDCQGMYLPGWVIVPAK